MANSESHRINTGNNQQPFQPGDSAKDYYSLLGLSRFASDPLIIKKAAEEKSNQLVQQFVGRDPSTLKHLLHEVSVARTCLENPQAKATYDSELLGRMAMQKVLGKNRIPTAQADPSPVPTHSLTQSPFPQSEANEVFPGQVQPGEKPPLEKARSRRNSSMLHSILSCFFGGVLGLAMGYIILCKLDLSYDFLNLWK